MLKYSPTTDDGRSRVGYFYIFILDYKNPPPHSSLVRYPLIYIVICKYFKINIQIEIKQTYCSHYSQVLYKFSLSTSTIFINDKNVVYGISFIRYAKNQKIAIPNNFYFSFRSNEAKGPKQEAKHRLWLS